MLVVSSAASAAPWQLSGAAQAGTTASGKFFQSIVLAVSDDNGSPVYAFSGAPFDHTLDQANFDVITYVCNAQSCEGFPLNAAAPYECGADTGQGTYCFDAFGDIPPNLQATSRVYAVVRVCPGHVKASNIVSGGSPLGSCITRTRATITLPDDTVTNQPR
jgi:hypothetical protein